MSKGAEISDCGLYRYSLWRVWSKRKPRVLFVGLNPSTADAMRDDNTIRRCIRFAYDWGYGGLMMGNLFAFRETDSKRLPALSKTHDIIGPENNDWLTRMAQESNLIIAAWGKNRAIAGRDDEVVKLLKNLHCLGLTECGNFPRHPLYLKASTQPIPFRGDLNL